MKKVVVIGAGPAGLSAIKSCLESGMSVICYEITSHLGGVWKYDDNQVDEYMPSMFHSVRMNTSRDLTSFSDFPAPAHFSNYMHHSQMYRYIQMYADHFNLRSHVRLRHRVVRVAPSSDFDLSGRWLVKVLDMESGVEVEETFDFVMVCTGVNFLPNVPRFEGVEDFKGRVIHSRSYKKPEAFRDQNIVVVGMGNSGADIAVDVCRVGAKTYLSTRRGGWLFRRAGENGIPSDTLSLTRFKEFQRSILPFNLFCWITERNIQRGLDHHLYGLKPKHRVFSQFPIVTDNLHLYLLFGDIVLKRDIAKFTSDGVIFEGDRAETLIDTIICATGYTNAFPFLEAGIVDVENPDDIYQFIFPLRPKHQTLALIGYAAPDGALFPILEMQARMAVHVFAGKTRLPSKAVMKAKMTRNREIFRREFYPGYRKLTHVRWVIYMKELACAIGAKPNLFWMFLTDPRLFWQCLFGPCLPFQFRLRGPHAWKGARKVILEFEDRLGAPLGGVRPECGFSSTTKAWLILPVVILGLGLLAFNSKVHGRPIRLELFRFRYSWK